MAGAALLTVADSAHAAKPPSTPVPTSAGIVRAAEGRLPELLACLRQQQVPLVGAHRGGPLAEHPENATATFDYTTSLAPVFIETDVQQTFDGVLFMNHDGVLDRNTTGHGVIAEQPWARISQLKLRDPTGQPTEHKPQLLSDVLKWADGRVLLLLDVKPQTDADLLMAEVSRAKADGRVMFLAYTIPQAQAFRALRPNAVVALPVFDREQLAKAKAAGLVDGKLLAMVRAASAEGGLVAEIEAHDRRRLSEDCGRRRAHGTVSGRPGPLGRQVLNDLSRRPLDPAADVQADESLLIPAHRPAGGRYGRQ